MNGIKKLLCALAVLMLLFSAVPAGIAAIPDGMEGPEDTAQLAERIYKLMEEYPSGSYFSKNGKSCVSHANSIANCIEVTAEQAGTPGNRQCFGFARMVFWHLFGKPYPHYNDSKPWLITGDEMENVELTWSADPATRMDEAAVRAAFATALPGDVIQCGIPHSMTFLQTEEEGILVYDANFEMSTCRVLVHVVDWDRLIKWIRRYGMSRYRAVNYPQTVNHEPFTYTSFNGGDVANIRIAAHPAAEQLLFHDPDLTGLTLIYTKGTKQCTLTCTDKQTFQMTGAFGNQTLTLGGDGEYDPSVTLTPGEGRLSGSVQIGFLGVFTRLICTVVKREPELVSYEFPADCNYRLGETFDPSGAGMTVRDEYLETREYKDGEIVFSGLDLTVPGEYHVTMEAGGLISPAFTVTVIRGVSTTAPLNEDPPVTGWARVAVAALVLSGAVAVGLFALHSVRRSRGSRR